MQDFKARNIEIFEDTCRFIEENQVLREDTEKSKRSQRLYLQENEGSLAGREEKSTGEGAAQKREEGSHAKVTVSGKRSFQAAEAYAKAGRRVCVLNFASASHPGGGVKHGASAQEEALCRCSNLYPCLSTGYMRRKFYQPHKNAHNPFHNDDVIYTPDVWVFKSDTGAPERLPEAEWYRVDVLTCAAPNLHLQSLLTFCQLVDVLTCAAPNLRNVPENGGQVDMARYRSMMERRIDKIFKVAKLNGAEVLILGAFGCGAFKNPPEVVAELFAKAVEENKLYFDVIEFAVYHTERDARNYHIFEKYLA